MADFQVVFDNFDLNTIPYVEFVRRFPNSEAERDLVKHEILRRDGSVLTSARHKDKTIALEGFINAPNRIEYETALDTLKYRTSAIERPLLIEQAGSPRVYIATKENIIEEHIEGGRARVNINFLCTSPFGRKGAQTEATETLTTNSTGLAHIFEGSALARPVFTITINSVTGGTAKYVGIANSSTGQQIQVTRNWQANDVVQFDTDSHKVYVNAAVSAYDGVFPSFTPDAAHAVYVDNLTTRNVTVKLVYTAQYL